MLRLEFNAHLRPADDWMAADVDEDFLTWDPLTLPFNAKSRGWCDLLALCCHRFLLDPILANADVAIWFFPNPDRSCIFKFLVHLSFVSTRTSASAGPMGKTRGGPSVRRVPLKTAVGSCIRCVWRG